MNTKLLIKIIIFTMLSLLSINTVYLDYLYFLKKDDQKLSLPVIQQVIHYDAKDSSQVKKNVVQNEKMVDSCYPYSCVDLIRQATASSPIQKTANASVVSAATREYYVPFGNGETKSDQYEDIPGLQANIDSSKYGRIKKVTFEVSMRIPTANGKIYVQLFNATDKHPVWFSEVSSEENISKLVISPPVTLDQGEKLYKVQAKTTLKFQSIIDQARVHIIAE